MNLVLDCLEEVTFNMGALSWPHNVGRTYIELKTKRLSKEVPIVYNGSLECFHLRTWLAVVGNRRIFDQTGNDAKRYDVLGASYLFSAEARRLVVQAGSPLCW
jgi:hypothetical protein